VKNARIGETHNQSEDSGRCRKKGCFESGYAKKMAKKERKKKAPENQHVGKRVFGGPCTKEVADGLGAR